MPTKFKKQEKGELNGSPFSFGIVVAEWNPDVTEKLLFGAIETLKKLKVPENQITVIKVPGSVELTKGAQWLANTMQFDAIICLGCVIQGETKHFDYVCQSVTHGITELNLQYDIPFIFGVLTTLNQQQALERAGGKHGNKGSECAETAIKMAYLRKKVEGNTALKM
ncbi:MAG: 6,7-dimethyl-8-ribityllumazine synthase [Bacteroidales bacterium]|nr:6,7-dimethyl-8-ribityllumazine synthase [Bacteroidales bacterium]